MADEDPGPREDGCALARGQLAAEIDDRAARGGSITPAIRGKLARVAVMRRAAEDKGVAGMKDSEFAKQVAPVFAAPVLRLDFGAHADRNHRPIRCRTEDFGGPGMFIRCKKKGPVPGIVEINVAKIRQVAKETGAFGFIGLLRLLPQVPLHIFIDRHPDQAADTAETEKDRVAARGLKASGCSQIDEGLRTPADELPPEREQFERIASPDDVLEVAVDETAGSEDLGGGGSLDVDREVGQHAAFSPGKGTGDEV